MTQVVELRCPGCQAKLRLKNSRQARAIRCPKCQRSIPLGAAKSSADAPLPARSAGDWEFLLVEYKDARCIKRAWYDPESLAGLLRSRNARAAAVLLLVLAAGWWLMGGNRGAKERRPIEEEAAELLHEQGVPVPPGPAGKGPPPRNDPVYPTIYDKLNRPLFPQTREQRLADLTDALGTERLAILEFVPRLPHRMYPALHNRLIHSPFGSIILDKRNDDDMTWIVLQTSAALEQVAELVEGFPIRTFDDDRRRIRFEGEPDLGDSGPPPGDIIGPGEATKQGDNPAEEP